MISFVRKYLPTVQGRIVAGLVFVIAVVVGLWPDQPRPFDPVRAGAIATAAIAWLFAELAGAGEVSGHDVKLFDKFRDTVKDTEKNFLRDQDFHASFVYSRSEGLREMAYWAGAPYEFVDGKLQAKWQPLMQQVDVFVGLMAQYAAPVGGNVLLMTVHPNQGDPDNPEPWVLEEIATLNAAASALSRELDEFERFARRRLGL